MEKPIDFKNVAHVVRFDIFGSLHMKTPSEFESLPDDEKRKHYQALFDMFHDACDYLIAHLQIDDLNERYQEA